jgi:hypothetical protein
MEGRHDGIGMDVWMEGRHDGIGHWEGCMDGRDDGIGRR